MNRFTFFMQPASHFFKEFAKDDGSVQWYGEVDEIYLLRWETKYSRSTAMRNVKMLVKAHVMERMARRELTLHEVFADMRDHRWNYIVEWCKADAHGFPKIVRLDQPEKFK